MKDLTFDLEDLVESVKAVENDPYKFGLEIEEVERRRRLVGEVGGEVDEMRAELKRTVKEIQSKNKAPINHDVLPDPDSFDDEDEYAAFEEERQLEMMHEQDEALDGVFKTVGNLRQQADDMGRELEEQTVMIKDVDDIADRVGGKLQSGIKKVGWVIKQNEGMQLIQPWKGVKLTFFRHHVKLLYCGADICSHPSLGASLDSLKQFRARDFLDFAT